MNCNNKSIRTVRINPVGTNTGKRETLSEFVQTCTRGVNLAISMLQDSRVPALPPREITERIELPYSRTRQLVAKQASAVVRSIRSKRDKIAWKQQRDYHLKKSERELLASTTVPEWSGNLDLDSRFVRIETNRSSRTEYWVRFTLPGNPAFVIPLRWTRPCQNLLDRGYKLKTNCVRLNRDGTLNLMFIQVRVGHSSMKNMIGIDVGIKKALTTSDGQIESTHRCGRRVNEILVKMTRQKSGSRRHARTRRELLGQINYTTKHDIPWGELHGIAIERLSDMKRNRSTSHLIQHWRYPIIRARLIVLAEEHGVRCSSVDPAYTSQTCSCCHRIDRTARQGEIYRCDGCGLLMDADLNAAINIRERAFHSSSSTKMYEST